MDPQIFTEHGMNTKKDLEMLHTTTGLVLDIGFLSGFNYIYHYPLIGDIFVSLI